MTYTNPPRFQFGLITSQVTDGADERFYVAFGSEGDRPVVILCASGRGTRQALIEHADHLANTVLTRVPGLDRRHPHQIDWYVTDWCHELDRAGQGNRSVIAHLERQYLYRSMVRRLELLTFQVVGSAEGRAGYRVAGPLVSRLEEQPEALLIGLENAYERVHGAVRWS